MGTRAEVQVREKLLKKPPPSNVPSSYLSIPTSPRAGTHFAAAWTKLEGHQCSPINSIQPTKLVPPVATLKSSTCNTSSLALSISHIALQICSCCAALPANHKVCLLTALRPHVLASPQWEQLLTAQTGRSDSKTWKSFSHFRKWWSTLGEACSAL